MKTCWKSGRKTNSFGYKSYKWHNLGKYIPLVTTLRLLLYMQYVFLVYRLPYRAYKCCPFPNNGNVKHTWTSRASFIGNRLDFFHLSPSVLLSIFIIGFYVFFLNGSFLDIKILGVIAEFFQAQFRYLVIVEFNWKCQFLLYILIGFDEICISFTCSSVYWGVVYLFPVTFQTKQIFQQK